MSLRKKHSLILIGLVVVLGITFETLQQQYYIRRFELAQDISFLELFKNQAYRWLIWLLLGFALVPASRWALRQKLGLLQKSLFLGGFIVFLVVLNVFCIALIDASLQGEGGNWSLIWSEFLPFFAFQKSPMYLLGYIAVSVILGQQLANEVLHFKIETLSELKKSDAARYEQLAQKQTDRAQVLNIKIGNKRKIIPVSDILWIASDDYCVKVHTADQSFSMRSSLKQLETTLGHPFVRIHRQAIVNMDAVSEYRASDNAAVLIGKKEWVPVSRKNLSRVKTYLQHSS